MGSLMIENGFLLTVNEREDIVPNGYILIEGDRIMTVVEGTAPISIRSQVNAIFDADGQILRQDNKTWSWMKRSCYQSSSDQQFVTKAGQHRADDR